MSLIPTNIDREGILRSLNINVRDPKHQAALLIAERYNLDPVLKHVVLISGNPYVTRDGLLHVAHQTGMLDGIVVEDESETKEEWQAKVTVYVKGQAHGYSYRGRYPKDGQQKRYGPEMAVKCAEVMALRRAFGVTGIPTVEEQWDKADAISVQARPAAPRPAQPAEIAGGVSATSPPAAPSPASTAPGGAKPADSSESRPELNAAGDGEVSPPPIPSGPDSAASEPNRKAGAGAGSKGAGAAAGGSPAKGKPAPKNAGGAAVSATAPSGGSLKEINERAYGTLNRYCRKVHAEHGDQDKQTAEAQWEALNWAISGARTTRLRDLTPDEASMFRTRMVDVKEGRATWVESNDPAHLGYTLAYRDAA